MRKALAHEAGTEWRTESLGFNPYANLPVDQIGVRFIDGNVVDYTVKVTDALGSFYVWARNLDRALELQWKTGDARAFNLRGYEVDFAGRRPADNDNGAWREATFNEGLAA